jgi:hypothetical protein
MRTPAEVILSLLPAASDQERVALIMVTSFDGSSHIEMRQQSFSEGIGWFTQATVRLEPQQVADLRNALGAVVRPDSPAATARRSFSRVSSAGWNPRVVQADSA